MSTEEKVTEIWAAHQLTEQQAIDFHSSEIWKGWSDKHIVDFQLFQKRLAIPFGVFQEAMNRVLNRPVFTHEFGERNNLVKEYLGEKEKPSFEEILKILPADKLFLVGYRKIGEDYELAPEPKTLRELRDFLNRVDEKFLDRLFLLQQENDIHRIHYLDENDEDLYYDPSPDADPEIGSMSLADWEEYYPEVDINTLKIGVPKGAPMISEDF